MSGPTEDKQGVKEQIYGEQDPSEWAGQVRPESPKDR